MTNEEYEFMLQDRIAKIQAINEQWDLENNSYVSDSGGLDSRVNRRLIDIALPNNRIPSVYFNTGIEYTAMVDFVKSLAEKDERFVIINSGVNIKKMLSTEGYPFKSKQHSHNWSTYYNNKDTELDDTIKFLENNPDKVNDYDYIHNLPNGLKTTIKYVFGIREKTTDIKITDVPINEYSKEYNDWGIHEYITEKGIIEKDMLNSVVEREREHYSKLYCYNDLP